MTSAAAIAPSRSAPSSPSPRASPVRNPAANKSPAPVVSTRLWIGSADTSARWPRDRKSTRLNSSHSQISYAVFCLNDTASTEIYTLSLHDALPIFGPSAIMLDDLGRRDRAEPERAFEPEPTRFPGQESRREQIAGPGRVDQALDRLGRHVRPLAARSEEHTSELQSQSNLVCRLLLERHRVHRDLHSFPTRRSSDLRAERHNAG